MEVIFSTELAAKYPQFSITKFVEDGGDFLALDLCNAAILRQRVIFVPLTHTGANSDEERVKKMVFLFAQYDLPLVNYIVDADSDYAGMLSTYLTQYLGTEDVAIKSSKEILQGLKALSEKYDFTLEEVDPDEESADTPTPKQLAVNHEVTLTVNLTDDDKKMKLDDVSALGIANAKRVGDQIVIPVSFTSDSNAVEMNEVLHSISNLLKECVVYDKKTKSYKGQTAFGDLLSRKEEVILLPHLIPTVLPLKKFIAGTFKVGVNLASDPDGSILEVR